MRLGAKLLHIWPPNPKEELGKYQRQTRRKANKAGALQHSRVFSGRRWHCKLCFEHAACKEALKERYNTEGCKGKNVGLCQLFANPAGHRLVVCSLSSGRTLVYCCLCGGWLTSRSPVLSLPCQKEPAEPGAKALNALRAASFRKTVGRRRRKPSSTSGRLKARRLLTQSFCERKRVLSDPRAAGIA